MTHLRKGDLAPDFKTVDQDGNEFELSSMRGSKVILFFYPKDDSPGCTRQACSFRDNYRYFEKLGYKIYGISPDNQKKHKKFVDKYEFQFTLLEDVDRHIIEKYGLWGPKIFMGKEIVGVYRTSFVINEKGIIEHVIENLKTTDYAVQLKEVL